MKMWATGGRPAWNSWDSTIPVTTTRINNMGMAIQMNFLIITPLIILPLNVAGDDSPLRTGLHAFLAALAFL